MYRDSAERSAQRNMLPFMGQRLLEQIELERRIPTADSSPAALGFRSKPQCQVADNIGSGLGCWRLGEADSATGRPTADGLVGAPSGSGRAGEVGRRRL